MNLHTIDCGPRTGSELRRVPIRLRGQIDLQLEFLLEAPCRSRLGVRVRAARQIPEVWHFHATKGVRVVYLVEGDVLWVRLVGPSTGVGR